MPFPLDIKFVHRAETTLGRSLPMGYVRKMCCDNGGELQTDDDDWSLHPIFDDSDVKRLKRTCNDILRESESARAWEAFPKEALAIGNNGCGDYLVLVPEKGSGRFEDSVYCWRHETGELNKISESTAELFHMREGHGT